MSATECPINLVIECCNCHYCKDGLCDYPYIWNIKVVITVDDVVKAYEDRR
jgi:hypothetical protein